VKSAVLAKANRSKEAGEKRAGSKRENWD